MAAERSQRARKIWAGSNGRLNQAAVVEDATAAARERSMPDDWRYTGRKPVY